MERVIVAEGPAEITERTQLIRDLLEHGIYVDLVSSRGGRVQARSACRSSRRPPDLSYSPVRLELRRERDQARDRRDLRGIMLVVLSPLLAYIAVRIKLDSPGPVLFSRTVVGSSAAGSS